MRFPTSQGCRILARATAGTAATVARSQPDRGYSPPAQTALRHHMLFPDSFTVDWQLKSVCADPQPKRRSQAAAPISPPPAVEPLGDAVPTVSSGDVPTPIQGEWRCPDGENLAAGARGVPRNPLRAIIGRHRPSTSQSWNDSARNRGTTARSAISTACERYDARHPRSARRPPRARASRVLLPWPGPSARAEAGTTAAGPTSSWWLPTKAK